MSQANAFLDCNVHNVLCDCRQCASAGGILQDSIVPCVQCARVLSDLPWRFCEKRISC